MQHIAIAVVRQDEKVLIGLRPEGVPLAGFWEFPGGKVESGESSADAARRECREETGLEVTPLEPYLTETVYYDHGSVKLVFHPCICNDPERMPTPPYRWVATADLAQYQFPEGNRRLIAQLTNTPEAPALATAAERKLDEKGLSPKSL
jgi:mutator protein MutT